MRKLTIIVVVAFVLRPAVCMAGGEIYERKLSSTSLGTCDNDLIEGVSQSGGSVLLPFRGFRGLHEIDKQSVLDISRERGLFLVREMQRETS